ncbi:MAG TPA: dihydrofolate reductase family protein [Candidatus Saccharimonadia bacterium]|nr:dihydrofolate reductase family protein [Candidatus Saccharimonadia bacterium]
MGKIIVSEFVTLDMVFEDPGGAEGTKYGGWSLEFNSAEYGKFKFEELMSVGSLLLGRATYEEFASAWPKMKDHAGEFGDKMNSMPKYVITSKLDKLEWNNSHILQGEPAEAIAKLKQESQEDILVNGSSELLKLLLAVELVDELRLMVHPVVLGQGKRLFDDVDKTIFKLSDTRKIGEDTVVLFYRPAEA